jgi:hypothetical protein
MPLSSLYYLDVYDFYQLEYLFIDIYDCFKKSFLTLAAAREDEVGREDEAASGWPPSLKFNQILIVNQMKNKLPCFVINIFYLFFIAHL